ncbi:amino acid permease [Nocardia rhamnosiphila]
MDDVRRDADPGRLTELGTAEDGVVGSVPAGTVPAYYSFVGFETSVNLAEEVTDPRRSYPRALFGAILTAGVVYLLTGVVARATVPAERWAESSGPLLEVVRPAGSRNGCSRWSPWPTGRCSPGSCRRGWPMDGPRRSVAALSGRSSAR